MANGLQQRDRHRFQPLDKAHRPGTRRAMHRGRDRRCLLHVQPHLANGTLRIEAVPFSMAIMLARLELDRQLRESALRQLADRNHQRQVLNSVTSPLHG